MWKSDVQVRLVPALFQRCEYKAIAGFYSRNSRVRVLVWGIYALDRLRNLNQYKIHPVLCYSIYMKGIETNLI